MTRYLNIVISIFVLVLIIPNLSSAQDSSDIRIGEDQILKSGPNYYNYSDKDKVNIEVSMWGYVRNPGKYLVPQGTRIIDLIPLGGGPTVEANLEDIRIVRLKNDTLSISKDQIIKVNYNDFLWEDDISSSAKKNPQLMPGDMVLLPGEPRYFFRENLGMILSISSALISLAILILNITNN